MVGKRASSIKYLESIFLKGIAFQRHGILKKSLRLQAVFRNAIWSWLKRRKIQKREGVSAPIAIAFSPTMRCNLSCTGCYARDYPRDGELSLVEIDEMLESAEELGVFLFVITGGEPLMREGILDVFDKHRKLLFLMITNGTLLDARKAGVIARAGNIIPVVSLEGSNEQTDARRGDGMHDKVLQAMEHLRNAEAVFGFSAMVTSENSGTLSSDHFVDEMIERGCALGFYTEYVPVGSAARRELVLKGEDQKRFRERILEFRRSRPIMVVHLPDDEYESDGKCIAVTGGCVHINSQGYAEPCPFTHFASDNIREKGFDGIFRSEFLAQVRASDAIIRRGHFGCSLFENRDMLEDIASKTGAKPTDRPAKETVELSAR